MSVIIIICLVTIVSFTQNSDANIFPFPGSGSLDLSSFLSPIVGPQSAQSINTQFKLYTRSSPSTPQMLNVANDKSITNSFFNPNNPTKVVVHGFAFFGNNFFIEWLTRIKDEFLNADDFNVVIVDWSGGNGPNYAVATANTRVVGSVIAKLIKKLQSVRGHDMSRVHVLGHSLGAEIAGFVGSELNGQLGRITGLDPAGPNFEGAAPADRLDPTDALFVDVIHSNGKPLIPTLGFGAYGMVGHLDFYPNGGQTQPGCLMERATGIFTSGLKDGVTSAVACDHFRACDFYIESINPNNGKAVGYQAYDYESFLRGESTDCGPNGDKCAILGEDAINSFQFKSTTIGKKYFLTTSSKYPFFTPEYGIKVKISSNKGGQKDQLIAKLRGTEDEQSFTLNEGEEELKSGQTYTYVVNSDYPLGDIISVSVKRRQSIQLSVKTTFLRQGSLFGFGGTESSDLVVDNIQVVPMSSKYVFDKIKHSQEIKTFCSQNPNQAIGGEDEEEINYSIIC